MKLRRLNDEGLRRFSDYLEALKLDPALAPPDELLTEPATSEEVARVEIEKQKFGTRLEAGRWLHSVLEQTRIRDTAQDKGLWAWLSLLHFDSVCPPDGRGHRKPGERARHIPDTGNYLRYYRHLLAGPWRIVRAHRDDPRRALCVLHNPVNTPGDLAEQIMARQEIVTNRTAMAAATQLYIDPAGERRRGAASKTNGGARRLADFCNQLDVTWDLYAMEPQELLAKLPREFRRFQPAQ
jgi:hypothetical protein